MFRIPLTYLDEAPLREIAALSMEELKPLMQKLQEAVETQERRKKIMIAALKIKFGERTQQLLEGQGKSFGTVHFEEEGTPITSVIRKRVDWAQDQIQIAIQNHPELKEYAKITYTFDEATYNKLPATLKEALKEARTIKLAGCEISLDKGGEDAV